MEKHLLSKSTFIRSAQCQKSLYLHKKRPFLRDKMSPEQQAKFKRGTRVGELARDLFPHGINMAPKSPSQYQQAVVKTKEAIEAGEKVIYEATFQFDRVLVMMDVLVNDNGKFFAYEVKSSKRISSTYILDAALQYYVITNSGLELEDIALVYVNPDYERDGELDLKDFFVIRSVKDQVLDRQLVIADNIEEAKNTLKLKKSPLIDIGPHCRDPYPCDFIGHCWKHIKKNSVFDLHFLNPQEKFDAYKKGIIAIEDLDVPESDHTLYLEKQAYINQKPYYSHQAINPLRLALKDQFYLLHFFMIRPAIPVAQGMKPYESIPAMLQVSNHRQNLAFEWSLDIKDFSIKGFTDVLSKIKKLNVPVIIFSDNNDGIDILKSVFHDQLFNLYDLFDSGQYIHPDLRGEFTAENISNILLNSSPFTMKNYSNELFNIKLNDYLLEGYVAGKEDIGEKARLYLEQYLKFEYDFLYHLNELL